MNIRKISLLLLMSLFSKTSSFSQDTLYPKITEDSLIVILPTQLKQTNIIFLEHKKLLYTNEELKEQVQALQEIKENYSKTDSLRQEQLNTCRSNILNKEAEIKELNETVKKQKKKNRIKNWVIGGLSAIVVIAAAAR